MMTDTADNFPNLWDLIDIWRQTLLLWSYAVIECPPAVRIARWIRREDMRKVPVYRTLAYKVSKCGGSNRNASL